MFHFKQIIANWNSRRELAYEEVVRQTEAKGEMKLFLDPASNKWLIEEYQIPGTVDDGHGGGLTQAGSSGKGKYLTTIAEFRQGFKDNYSNRACSPSPYIFDRKFWSCPNGYRLGGNRLEGYADIARATVAGWAGLTTTAPTDGSMLSGDDAWTWINSPAAQLVTQPWNYDPRYAIVPYPDTVPKPSGTLMASAAALSYQCTLTGNDPANQTVLIGASGVTLTNFSVVNNEAWLTVSPPSGTSAGSLTPAVSCSGLAAGNYSDVITISSTTPGITASIQIAVDLTVYDAPVVTTDTLPPMYPDNPYSAILSSSGGNLTPAPTWDIAAGSLGMGLFLSPNGVISGTPTVAAPSSFTVRVTDGNGVTAIHPLLIQIASDASVTSGLVYTKLP
jgi:hypothetical protein